MAAGTAWFILSSLYIGTARQPRVCRSTTGGAFCTFLYNAGGGRESVRLPLLSIIYGFVDGAIAGCLFGLLHGALSHEHTAVTKQDMC